jgi:hypothetical protein
VSNAIEIQGTRAEVTAALVTADTLVVAATAKGTISDAGGTDIAATDITAINDKTSGTITISNAIDITGAHVAVGTAVGAGVTATTANAIISDSAITGAQLNTLDTAIGGTITTAGGTLSLSALDTLSVAATSAVDTFVVLQADGTVAITGFKSVGADKLDLQEIGDANSAVSVISAGFSITDNEVYYVDGSGTANSADTITASADLILAAAGGGTNVDDGANVFESIFVVIDDNSTSIYKYVNNNTDDSDILDAELTLIGIIDSAIASTDIIV